ncbi:MAG: replicative DNA helicase [Puniceicoccales bacterium]|jgi:replicative DNA helicase|nr:replicative DNA helicase [Puniceicoccales bacterium]
MATQVQSGVLRTPPHSIELEQALLGCCVVEGGQESLSLCIQKRLSADSFYFPAHRVLFGEMYELYQRNRPLSEITLRDALLAKERLAAAGGGAYLAQICSRVDVSAHLPYFIDRVRDYELLRRVISSSETLIAKAFDGQEDVARFLAEAEEKIFSISKDLIQETAQPIDGPLRQAIQNVQSLLQRKGEISGIGSGFADLDRITGGFHPAEMIVLAARPSMGKTSLALNLAENVILPTAKNAQPVATLFFSLEMSADQLAMRLLCGRAGVKISRLREGAIPRGFQNELLRVAQEFRGAPLWIDESSNLTILELRARARRVHCRQKLGLVIIDYLQLIAGTDSRAHREQQIAEISRGVKAMAKELHLPVLVLSQLNRESERERRQPKLSDLRESGAIEQDADVVLLLSRPRETDEETEMSLQTSELVRELIIAKQRNGPVGVVPLLFDRSITKFGNYRDDGTDGERENANCRVGRES